MLQIEVGGRRLLYTGDFRCTGRKAGLVQRLIRVLPRPVDLLLMEGTCIGRPGSFPTEDALVDTFVSHFNDTPGRVFISWSAQNIDRTCTIYKACRRAGRTLILDVYSLDVLDRLAATGAKLPTLDYPNMRAVITRGVARLYQNPSGLNAPDVVTKMATSGRAISASRLNSLAEPFVIMLRPSLFRDFRQKGMTLSADDRWLFSQWSGYRKKPDFQAVERAFVAAGARVEQVHTSGHASIDELVSFSNAIGAKHFVPIHSDQWDRHLHKFRAVTRLLDGDVFELL
jgi:ribonuclease J